MDELMGKMTALHARIAKGGSEKARAKHVGRGKMLARE
jgi:3-methylcrotonyl-CoA carboxylase beta subunit